MSNKNKYLWPNIWKLIWGNPILRVRIIWSIFSTPIFILIGLLILHYFGFKTSSHFVLLILSGLFYHLYVTIFTISGISSYLKFILGHGILLKIIFLIYLVGLFFSFLNCAILTGYISLNYLNLEVGQIYFAFAMSNFVLAPIGLWLSSYEFVKTDLFGLNLSFYQPRSLHVTIMLIFLLIFSLLLDARTEFEWSFSYIFLILISIVGIIAIFFGFIIETIFLNSKNTIAE